MTQLACRLCGNPLNRTFVDLGRMPLANAFVTPYQAAAGVDCAWPLHVRACDECRLVQVEEVVPSDTIFSDYPYFSSYSSSWVEHARRYAVATAERFALNARSLVIEIASNDGYLLRHFQAASIPVLGVEPAGNVAAAARAIGVPTEEAFFGVATATRIAAQHGRADLVVANNVLAHVPDLFGFAAGIPAVLRTNGVATFEFPHLLNLIEAVQFDTIYHEHYSYLSLLVVERVFRSVGLRVFDVERLPTHGGSLRVYACHAGAPIGIRPSVAVIRSLEAAAGLDKPERYDDFAERVAAVQRGFHEFILDCRRSRRRLAAYGAAAKGNTLLNGCGIGKADITCVADRNPAKQGRLLPGSHVPIVSPEALLELPPDDLLILPWNLATEIAAELAPLRQAGTLFWIACPSMQRV